MGDQPWWKGNQGVVFSEAFVDFLLSAYGLNKAVKRLSTEEDAHTAIECCWWLGAASEACGRHFEDSLLGAFYWVRNKGFHETATALGRIIPSGSNEIEPGVVMTIPEARWLPLPDGDLGRRVFYNRYLAGRPVLGTLADGRDLIVSIWDSVRSESGVRDLPPL